MESKAMVIYDPDCGFCHWCLAILLTWDRRRRGTGDGEQGERRGGAERGRPSPPDWQLRWGRSAARGALRPLPLGTPEADRLLVDLSPEERASSWHLILDSRAPADLTPPAVPAVPAVPGRSAADASPGAARFSAGAALAPALRLLPGGRIPASLFARFPRTTERAYRGVANHRGLLGRFVPSRARRWADRVIAAHGGPAASQ